MRRLDVPYHISKARQNYQDKSQSSKVVIVPEGVEKIRYKRYDQSIREKFV